MEKLQAALEKARKTRQSETQVVTRADLKAPPVQRSSGVESVWHDLQELSVDSEKLEKRRLVTRIANSKATPFDILRTKVLLLMRQNNWKRLAITSPMPECGKTTTACNLALGFGRQDDLRSIVLDLDLRDPSISEFLNVVPEHGIGDVLTGKVSFADQAMRFSENVAFSMAKTPDQDPTRVLLAEETALVIDQIEATYNPDIMIFDLPSMLMNDDTRAFLKNVDCALIIVRADQTKYSHFDISEREIAEHTNVLGVVLNGYRAPNTKG